MASNGTQSSSNIPQQSLSLNGGATRKSVDQPTESSEPRQSTSAPQQLPTPTSEEHPAVVKPVSTAREEVAWTMTSFFDWNPKYLIQIRGIMNVLHVITNVVTLSLLGSSCQLRPYQGGPSEGFFCKPPETFLFVVSIGAFFTSFLYLICCILSKQTETILFQTSFEIGYFILYFILLLTGSIALMISIVSWSSDRVMYGNNYGVTQSAAVVGLVSSCFYGASSIWYFISHRYYDRQEAEAQ